MSKNYIQIVKDELETKTNCHGALLDLYTVLVFTRGNYTSLEDVHDAWAIWKNNKMPEHRSLIPFNELAVNVQELDRFYVECIRSTAIKFGIL